MLYREMPKTQDRLSILGFGCMRLPGRQSNPDEKKSIEQIRYAIDNGVNYVDTAWPYHGGKSEVILGKALKGGYREKVKVADKLPQWLCKNRDDMDYYLDEQLKRLCIDSIDYYLVHALNRETWKKAKTHGVFDFIHQAKASGRIVNIGFSFHGSREDFKVIIDDHDWDFCQIQFNILDENYQAGREGLDYAWAKNTGVIIMEPLRGGALAGWLPHDVKEIYKAAEPHRSNADWALRWIWNHPGVITVLSGMNDIAQIEENIRIASTAEVGSMSNGELNAVKNAAETFRRLMKVPCTACQYCMPCPAGVDIPAAFTAYNNKYLFKVGFMNRAMYLMMNRGGENQKPSFASQCINCGQCVEHCPQRIDIPNELKHVEKEFEGPLKKPTLFLINSALNKGRRK